MWLFSSLADANNSNDDESTVTTKEDEESTRIEPQKTLYSATSSSCDDDVDDDDTKLQSQQHNIINGNGGQTIPMQQSNNNINNNNSQKKQRGIIYFRPISTSDRTAIQTLHEQWFPVDYKDDFFDALCTQQSATLIPGMNIPLYCCVACFKELNDDDYDEIDRLLKKKKQERDRGNSEGSWFGSWSGSNNSEGGATRIDDEEYGDGWLLWEFEEEDNDDTDRDTSVKEGGSYQDHTATFVDGQQSSSQTPTRSNVTYKQEEEDDDDSDDLIESGESATSIHYRREKERMERFYSNGFQFDDDAPLSSCLRNTGSSIPQSSITSGSKEGKNGHNHTSNSSAHENVQGPYYNDNGERIIGCIVGSFLPSNLPSSKQQNQSSRTEKAPPRDETASLLIPDCTTHPKMFYIMTLGTTREFRRCGLGSMLVNKVVNMIQTKEVECGALYLHVITYNKGAIRLYEKLGFMKVKMIKGERDRVDDELRSVHAYCYSSVWIRHSFHWYTSLI